MEGISELAGADPDLAELFGQRAPCRYDIMAQRTARTSARGGQWMATRVEIQKFVQRHHGFVPKTGWIAHVKALRGLPTRRAASRAGRGRRVEPCPPEKREAIEEALRHFGLI